MRIICLIALLLVSSGGLVHAASEQGTYTLTTYYPSPSGAYDDLTANDITVGTATVTNLAVSGSLNYNASKLSVPKLGINVANPIERLEINGGNSDTMARILSGGDDDYATLTLGRTSNEAYVAVAGVNGDFSTGSSAGDLVIRNTSPGAKVILANGGPANPSPVVVIKDNNVGINTTTPARELHILGRDLAATMGNANIILEGVKDVDTDRPVRWNISSAHDGRYWVRPFDGGPISMQITPVFNGNAVVDTKTTFNNFVGINADPQREFHIKALDNNATAGNANIVLEGVQDVATDKPVKWNIASVHDGRFWVTPLDEAPQPFVLSPRRNASGDIVEVNATFTGSVKVGTTSLACTAGSAGMMRYNAGNMEYCTGAGASWSWEKLSSPNSLSRGEYLFMSKNNGACGATCAKPPATTGWIRGIDIDNGPGGPAAMFNSDSDLEIDTDRSWDSCSLSGMLTNTGVYNACQVYYKGNKWRILMSSQQANDGILRCNVGCMNF